MVMVFSKIALDSRSFDLFEDFSGATYSNQEPGGFTATFSPGNFANVDGFGFQYISDNFPPVEGTVTGADLFINSRLAVDVSDLSITMQQAFAYSQLTPQQVAEDVFSGADTIVGSKFSDYIRGFDGTDQLNGGVGRDTLRGDEDRDHFCFYTDVKVYSNENAKKLADHIVDFGFDGVRDKIVLDGDIFGSVGPSVSTGEFRSVNGLNQNFDRNDYIVYDKNTNILYYDADGRGNMGADLKAFAVIDNNAAIKFSDFLIGE